MRTGVQGGSAFDVVNCVFSAKGDSAFVVVVGVRVED